jgi:hypothetical protein
MMEYWKDGPAGRILNPHVTLGKYWRFSGHSRPSGFTICGSGSTIRYSVACLSYNLPNLPSTKIQTLSGFYLPRLNADKLLCDTDLRGLTRIHSSIQGPLATPRPVTFHPALLRGPPAVFQHNGLVDSRVAVLSGMAEEVCPMAPAAGAPLSLPAGGGRRRMLWDCPLQSGVSYDHQRESV